MTLRMAEAKNGKITEEMKIVAEKEKVTPEFIRRGVASGRIVIVKNVRHEGIEPLGIGEGLFIKINANIGSSQKRCDVEEELEKARVAVKYGADTIMDLSSGPTEKNIIEIRKRIMEEIKVPIGTVPIYQVAVRTIEKAGGIINMDEDDMFGVIEEQAKEGVDFFTVHVGVTLELAEYIKKHPRFMGIVSRGGTMLAVWCLVNKKENPYYKNFDYLLEMAQDYDFGLSLGDGFRPGSVLDSTDIPQIQELITLGKLVKRAREKNVQVFVEGPGHIIAGQIPENMKIQKALCDGAPFYVLGPIVTDIAPGYDHLVGAIGGTIAALNGANFLCYVTPTEHLALPSVEDVKEGVIASKIAAHAADLTLRGEDAIEWDRKMNIARSKLDWETQLNLAINPDKARKIRLRDGPIEREEGCSMCGNLCAVRILNDAIAGRYEKIDGKAAED